MRNKTPATDTSPIGVLDGEVNGRHQKTGHFGLQQRLQVELGCLLCWFAAPSVTAQESESAPVVALLSLATIPPEVFTRELQKPPDPWAVCLLERHNGGVIAPHRASAEGEAWEKFEAEYRPKQRNVSPVMRQIESAKYQLDAATFGFDRLVRNIQDNTLFKFDNGRLRHAAPGDLPLRRTTSHSWTDGLQHIRVKFDVKPRIGQPYVGVRVIIPFGN